MKKSKQIILLLNILFSGICSANVLPTNSEKLDISSKDAVSVVKTEKEKILWFDAEANFSRFSKKSNITYYLDKAKATGFNKIVVDVRPIHGDALFKSQYLTPLTDVGNYHIERDWDYLQFFIDEAHKRNLKVAVSVTTFTGGNPSKKTGMAYRDNKWDGKTCIEYTKDKKLIDIKDDPSKVSAFLNPVLPEVQVFCLNFIKELVTNYDFDDFVLDYCRYPGEECDFSAASRKYFEEYIGQSLTNFPEDIFTWNADGTKKRGLFYKQWWEFRSMVIHNFIKKVRDEVKAIKPKVKLEYWAASWINALYANGQNWASNTYDFSKNNDWASTNYKKTGFAGLLDVFLVGTYLNTIYGKNDPESIEYGIARAKNIIGNSCDVYGTIFALNHKTNMEDAVYVCLSQSQGLMVFDIVQVIEFDEWDAIKKGIDRAEKINK